MDYNISDYGAVAGAQHSSRTGIQQAIDAAVSAGGGRVVVPAGNGSVVVCA